MKAATVIVVCFIFFVNEVTCKKKETPTDRCQLPPDPGPCRAKIELYYYDHKDNTCKTFFYGGCHGNDNKFDTKEDCEIACPAGLKTTNKPKGPIKKEDRCQLPPETGKCRAKFELYYYDHNDKKCKKFFYGGCDGNANRFDTKKECKKACPGIETVTGTSSGKSTTVPKPNGPTNDVKRRCRLPPITGSCRGLSESYHYDDNSKTCKKFVYGGCGGNDNRFDTVEQCNKVCSGMKSAQPCKGLLDSSVFKGCMHVQAILEDGCILQFDHCPDAKSDGSCDPMPDVSPVKGCDNIIKYTDKYGCKGQMLDCTHVEQS